MKVKIVADQLCDSEVGLGSAAHLAHRLIERNRLPEFVALTKPRVMMLAVFTALAGPVQASSHEAASGRYTSRSRAPYRSATRAVGRVDFTLPWLGYLMIWLASPLAKVGILAVSVIGFALPGSFISK